jgi:hypothetical protein
LRSGLYSFFRFNENGELGFIPQGTVGGIRFAWVPMIEIGVFFGLGVVFYLSHPISI